MKIKNQKPLLILTSLLLAGNINAQLNFGLQQIITSKDPYKFALGTKSVSIPFELVGNLVVISVEINNVKMRFILDTGMPMMGGLITNSQKASIINLYYSGEAQIGGAGGGFSKAKIANNIKFKIGSLEFYNQTFVVMPESQTLSYFETDGVIGNEIFTRFIVHINYDNQMITLSEPANYIFPKDAEEIKIPFESGIPYLKCSAILESGITVPLDMVLDLGASHNLSFVLGSQKNIVLPEKYLKVSTGRGVTKEIFGFTGRIKKFKIGSHSFDNPLVNFNENKLMVFEKEGNLGSGIMRRFNIIFDYQNKRLFIKPNRFFNDPFEFNMAGIQTSKSIDGIIKIDRVFPNSAGSEAGLLAGDIIVRINKISIAEIKKTELENIFKKEDEVVELIINRGEIAKTISVKLRRII